MCRERSGENKWLKKIASEARRVWTRASGVCRERSGEKKIVWLTSLTQMFSHQKLPKSQLIVDGG